MLSPQTRVSVMLYFTSAGGLGYLPKAPGTWGTIGAVMLYVPMSMLPRWAYVVTLVTLMVLAMWASHKAQQQLGEEDPQFIVIDEVVGYLTAMAFVPVTLGYVIAGFVLFRLFDIWKPQPVKFFDKMGNGFGIVADDVAAGAYALTLMLIWHLVF